MKTLILKRKALALSWVLATVLALAFTQCKKEETPAVTPTDDTTETLTNAPILPQGETVHITLKVNQNNDEKLDVTPPHVNFENGDTLYVASDGKYVGYLLYVGSNSEFVGDITGATAGQPLYFYLLGNRGVNGISWTVANEVTTGCSLDISNQHDYFAGQPANKQLPVVSCAPSNEDFAAGAAAQDFTAILCNQCALVKFKTNVISGKVTLGNMYNKANVNFATKTITPAATTGSISFATDANGVGWVILLSHNGEITSTVSATGYNSATVTIPAISNNDYLSNGIAVSLEAITIPDGAIGGLFTINGNGDQVYFSQGNLQWSGNNGWRFALHQYDFIGNAANNTSPTASNDNYMDLFCWGASGLNGAAPNTTNSYYTGGNNLSGVNDWGSNAIINGGNTTNSGWYTLSIAEWHYLFFDRTDANNKFGLATVNGVCGIIILPDDYSGSNITPFDFDNYDNNSWSYNVYSGEGWIAMENSGVVFLPAAGFRDGTNFFEGLIEGIGGSYWSSTSGNDGYVACCIVFNVMNFIAYDFASADDHGMSVRLVRNANSAK